jgi:transposase-like protein
MTPKAHHKQISAENQETLRELLQEKMKLAIQYTLIQALQEEVEAYIQAAPYERTQNRRDHRNGSYPRSLGTSLGELEDLPVPRTRKGFQSQLFERYRRRQAELDESICKRGQYRKSGRNCRNVERQPSEPIHRVARISHAGGRI